MFPVRVGVLVFQERADSFLDGSDGIRGLLPIPFRIKSCFSLRCPDFIRIMLIAVRLRDALCISPVASSRRLRRLALHRISLSRIIDGDMFLAFAANVFLAVLDAILGAIFGVLTVWAVFRMPGDYGVCRDQDVFGNHVLHPWIKPPLRLEVILSGCYSHSARTVRRGDVSITIAVSACICLTEEA